MKDLSGNGISRREALRISAVAGASLALGGAALAALVREGRLHRVEATRRQLGTIVSMSVIHPERGAGREMVSAAFGEMERLEAILSRHRPETPLSSLNRSGRIDDAPPELHEVVVRALDYSRLTGGAFDVTVAPLLSLVRSRIAATGELPGEEELARTLELVGYQQLAVVGSSIRFARQGMGITLDGIAKGWVVDRALLRLTSLGAERVLVDGGGDMASSGGQGPGTPWQLGIQDPWVRDGVLGVVRLQQGGIATSGDYVETFTPDRRHHHIVDPRTGRSPGGVTAVTVVAATAEEADALSTAALVLGPREGVALLEELPGVEGLVVSKSGTPSATTGFPGIG